MTTAMNDRDGKVAADDPEIIETSFCHEGTLMSKHGLLVEDLHELLDWATRNRNGAARAVMVAAELELTDRGPLVMRQLFSLWGHNVGFRDPISIVCLVSWFSAWRATRNREAAKLLGQTLDDISPRARELLLACVVYLSANYCQKSRSLFHLTRVAINSFVPEDADAKLLLSNLPASSQLGEPPAWLNHWCCVVTSEQLNTATVLDVESAYQLWVFYLHETQTDWADISQDWSLDAIHAARFQKGDPQMQLGPASVQMQDDGLFRRLFLERTCVTSLQVLLTSDTVEKRQFDQLPAESFSSLVRAMEHMEKAEGVHFVPRDTWPTLRALFEQCLEGGDLLGSSAAPAAEQPEKPWFRLLLFMPLFDLALDCQAGRKKKTVMIQTLLSLMEAVASGLETPDHSLLTCAVVTVCRLRLFRWKTPSPPTNPPSRLLEGTEIKKACHMLIASLRSSQARSILGYIEINHLSHRSRRVQRHNYPYMWEVQQISSPQEHTRLRYHAHPDPSGDPYLNACQQLLQQQERELNRWLSFGEMEGRLHEQALGMLGIPPSACPVLVSKIVKRKSAAPQASEVAFTSHHSTFPPSSSSSSLSPPPPATVPAPNAVPSLPSAASVPNHEISPLIRGDNHHSHLPDHHHHHQSPLSGPSAFPPTISTLRRVLKMSQQYVPCSAIFSSAPSSLGDNQPAELDLKIGCVDPSFIMKAGMKLSITLLPCNESPVAAVGVPPIPVPANNTSASSGIMSSTPAPEPSTPSVNETDSTANVVSSIASPRTTSSRKKKPSTAVNSPDNEVTASSSSHLDRFWNLIASPGCTLTAAQLLDIQRCPLASMPNLNRTKYVYLQSAKEPGEVGCAWKGPYSLSDPKDVKRAQAVVFRDKAFRFLKDPTAFGKGELKVYLCREAPEGQLPSAWISTPLMATAPLANWKLTEHNFKQDRSTKVQVLSPHYSSAGYVPVSQLLGEGSSQYSQQLLVDVLRETSVHLLYRLLFHVRDSGFNEFLLPTNSNKSTDMRSIDLDDWRPDDEIAEAMRETEAVQAGNKEAVRSRILKMFFTSMPTRKKETMVVSMIQQQCSKEGGQALINRIDELIVPDPDDASRFIASTSLSRIYSLAKSLNIPPNVAMPTEDAFITLASEVRAILQQFGSIPSIRSGLVKNTTSAPSPSPSRASSSSSSSTTTTPSSTTSAAPSPAPSPRKRKSPSACSSVSPSPESSSIKMPSAVTTESGNVNPASSSRPSKQHKRNVTSSSSSLSEDEEEDHSDEMIPSRPPTNKMAIVDQMESMGEEDEDEFEALERQIMQTTRTSPRPKVSGKAPRGTSRNVPPSLPPPTFSDDDESDTDQCDE